MYITTSRRVVSLILVAILFSAVAMETGCSPQKPTGEESPAAAPHEEASEGQRDSFESHREEGRRLLEKNCADCMGSSRAGLEQAIAELEKAAELSEEQDPETLRLLAEAYNVLIHVYLDRSPPEKNEYKSKRALALKRLVELQPNDAQVLMDYARTLAKPQEKTEIWKRVLQLDPTHAGAHRAIGARLLQDGEVDQGLGHWRAAYEASTGQKKMAYGRDLIHELRRHGRDQEAIELEKEVERYRVDWLGQN
ncbi:MAG TPA: hypothetical protein VLV83_15905 [Acidobacteriota bacterium]|nr:hypothetical protein [Acidobacteriota bacterium]